MSMKIKSAIMSLSALLCLVSPLAFGYGELESETVAGGNQAMVEKDGVVDQELNMKSTIMAMSELLYSESPLALGYDQSKGYLYHRAIMSSQEIAERESDFLSAVFDDEHKANIISKYFNISGVRELSFSSRSQIVDFFENEKVVLISSLGLDESEKNILSRYYDLRVSQEIIRFDRQESYRKRVKQHRSKKGHRKGGKVERDSDETVSDMKYGETKIIPINQQ